MRRSYVCLTPTSLNHLVLISHFSENKKGTMKYLRWVYGVVDTKNLKITHNPLRYMYMYVHVFHLNISKSLKI